ncbi:lysine--tRNA ligase [Malacoplasma penetrans]|uniref:Lysine--tRNA ligase n=1 Tax=Malacoplasma penetrans (strain HF-2) TaxID=272633 RepID=SYK_MALP2|nr:lysine--tRNA ligase [Malacoplasma penetrans]Q8EUS8.1 RecName: Full=Lysine--tRNA ligase; AltName: Full=Lysyl-tRNA synthetase; Short=LysRS [Malacoplasma penetrans HF-2]RXY96657.1 lysine--tRNA ligase [Malacoplasma penetrans]BAC44634.1 lysyl-tRNA synthetase [Malacoplasma penetrans HF-2]
MERKFNDQELIRREKLKNLQEANQDPYEIEKVSRTMTIGDFNSKFAKLKTHNTNNNIKLAGRVVALRQTFGVIRDFYGDTQFYLNKKKVSKSMLEYFNKVLDLGDIVEIFGSPFRTQKGELTLDVKKIKIVSKALKPLPEKWHGLEDEELRARHRYVDLIVNKDSMKVFVDRIRILKIIRQFMDSQNYLEVETPVLHPILGGANARPFITFHNTLERNFYLRIATELPLKKLIVGGFDKVYEIGRIFRNEGMDSTHNPEFTSMEVYAAYENMEYMMRLTENLFKYVAKSLKKPVVKMGENEIYLTQKFRRIHMVDFIKQETGVDFWEVKSNQEAQELAKKHNVKFEKHQSTLGHIINLFFEEFCEAKCIQPTFVYGHPIDVSPLSKKDYKNPGFTKRFELFINTKEYANAFAELNDPIDQYERFEAQVKEKSLGNDEAVEMDMDFIEALEYGLPPTAGLGVGIDRMIMLFTEKSSIRDVLLFPHMKDKK